MAQNYTLPYSPLISNDELLKRLQPAAEFAWRGKYTSTKGKLTGGILLHEWVEVLKDTAKRSVV